MPTTEVDTFVNVIKRREEILYRTSVPPQAANIAHVASSEVSSSSNLSVTDRSTSLQANRVREHEVTIVSDVKTFTIDTENFVVTDEFTTASQTITAIPLFYKHILSTENVPRDADNDLASTVQLLQVQFLDSLLAPVKTPEVKVDYTKGIIYNNLVSEYSSSSDYTIYYIKYVIRQNNEVKTFVDLLNNITAYRIATFDDLTAGLQIKTDGRKVYLIEEVASRFVITLPDVDTYAFKPTTRARIKILPPTTRDVTDPWYVKVTNGKFFTNLHGSLHKYHIAEFLSQAFIPEPPLKLSDSEESVVLTGSLIKLDNESVYQGVDHELYVETLISDRDDTALAAFTTDSSIVGNVAANGKLYQKWSNSSRVGIRSIDYSLGVVQIEGLILKSSYKVVSTYSFEEENYEVTALDFNPISNREALTTRASLFIDPDTSSTNKTQTLYYLKSDQSGKVFESNWGDFDNDTERHTDGELVYYEDFPDFFQITVSGEPDYLSPDSHKFVDEFSIGPSSGVFLILGDIITSEALSTEDLEIFDSRKRGGGIIDSLVEENLLEYPETQWFWDTGYWDGIPYPGNASYMVEVPVTVMEGAGGRFTAAEIRSIVEKHTAFGVYPVIKAYGVGIDYTAVSLLGGTKIEWTGMNTGISSGVRYNVYYSTFSKGPWTLANASPLVHDQAGNEYTITGLSKGTLYYILVAGGYIDDGEFVPLVTQPIGPSSEGARGIGAASSIISMRKHVDD